MANSKLQQPRVNINSTEKMKSVGINDPTALIIGALNEDNTTYTDLQKVVPNISWVKAKSLFGEDCLLTHAIKRFEDISPNTKLDVIPIKVKSGGTKAVAQIIFDGAVESTGKIIIRPLDDNFRIEYEVSKGKSISDIVGLLTLLINGNIDKYPFTAKINSSDNKILDLEMKTSGAFLNGLVPRIESDVIGLKISVKESVGGAGSFDIDNAISSISSRYHSIAFDESFSKDLVVEYLESVFNFENSLKSGVGFTVISKTIDLLLKEGQDTNNKVVVMFGNITEQSIFKSKYNYIPLLFLAEFIAIRSLRLTPNSNVSKYVKNSELESVGGPGKASLPYHGTPLSYLNSIEDRELEYDGVDGVKTFNDNGITFLNDTALGNAEINTVVLPYNLNSKGLKDLTYHFLNAVDTTFIFKEYIYLNLKNQFAQSRFIPEDASPVVNSDSYGADDIKSALISYYDVLADQNIVVKGDTFKQEFTDSIVTTVDNDTGSITINCSATIVNQIRNITINASFTR